MIVVCRMWRRLGGILGNIVDGIVVDIGLLMRIGMLVGHMCRGRLGGGIRGNGKYVGIFMMMIMYGDDWMVMGMGMGMVTRMVMLVVLGWFTVLQVMPMVMTMIMMVGLIRPQLPVGISAWR